MVITTTGIAFSISAIGLAFCGFWFSKAFQKIGGLRSGSRTGILLSVYFLGTAFQHGILAFGALFFVKNPEAHYAVLVIDNFVLGIITALAVYLAVYILLPNYSPWPATVVAFILGLFVTGLTITAHPSPFIDVNGSINWNMPRWTELPLYYLLLFQIGAPFLIFTRNLFQTTTRYVKIISSIIVVATFLGLVNISLLFGGFLKNTDALETRIFDRMLGIIGVLLVVGFLVVPMILGWAIKVKPHDES